MCSVYSVPVHFKQGGATDEEALGFFVYPAFGISSGVYLGGQFVEPPFDFQCAFCILGCKLFIPLHALTP